VGGRSGSGGSGLTSRARSSLDFLSIVTRFQLARRARAIYLTGGSTDEEDPWTYNALELDDFIFEHSPTRLDQLRVFVFSNRVIDN